jgi:hypothetical protein
MVNDLDPPRFANVYSFPILGKLSNIDVEFIKIGEYVLNFFRFSTVFIEDLCFKAFLAGRIPEEDYDAF